MDQLGRRRGGMACEIVHLDQGHRKSTTGRVARNAGAVDAAADDQQVARNPLGKDAAFGHACGFRLVRKEASSADARSGPVPIDRETKCNMKHSKVRLNVAGWWGTPCRQPTLATEP